MRIDHVQTIKHVPHSVYRAHSARPHHYMHPASPALDWKSLDKTKSSSTAQCAIFLPVTNSPCTRRYTCVLYMHVHANRNAFRLQIKTYDERELYIIISHIHVCIYIMFTRLLDSYYILLLLFLSISSAQQYEIRIYTHVRITAHENVFVCKSDVKILRDRRRWRRRWVTYIIVIIITCTATHVDINAHAGRKVWNIAYKIIY